MSSAITEHCRTILREAMAEHDRMRRKNATYRTYESDERFRVRKGFWHTLRHGPEYETRRVTKTEPVYGTEKASVIANGLEAKTRRVPAEYVPGVRAKLRQLADGRYADAVDEKLLFAVDFKAPKDRKRLAKLVAASTRLAKTAAKSPAGRAKILVVPGMSDRCAKFIEAWRAGGHPYSQMILALPNVDARAAELWKQKKRAEAEFNGLDMRGDIRYTEFKLEGVLFQQEKYEKRRQQICEAIGDDAGSIDAGTAIAVTSGIRQFEAAVDAWTYGPRTFVFAGGTDYDGINSIKAAFVESRPEHAGAVEHGEGVLLKYCRNGESEPEVRLAALPELRAPRVPLPKAKHRARIKS